MARARGQGGAPARPGPGAVSRRPGRWGLIDRACPHRGADLAFGRLEADGLRCPFHGWKFDADGRCLETPAEPAGSTLCSGSASAAIRCRSALGRRLRLARARGLGAAGAAGVRRLRRAGEPQLRLQGPLALQLAAGVRGRHRSGASVVPAPLPARTSRSSKPPTAGSSAPPAPARSAGERWPMTRVMREFCQPEIRFESVADGLLRLHRLRPMTDELTHVRVTHAAFPATFVDPAVGDDHDHADARAGRRHPHLLVQLLHQLRRAARQGDDARPAPGLCLAPGLRAAQGPAQPLGLRPRGAAHPHLPRHGRGRHQPARPVGGGEHGRDPGPHPGAPRHHRQGDHGQPAHPAEGDRDGARRRPAADGARARTRPQPSPGRTRSTASPRPTAGTPTGAAPPRPSAPARPGWPRRRRSRARRLGRGRR